MVEPGDSYATSTSWPGPGKESGFDRDDFLRFCQYDGPIPHIAKDTEILFSCIIQHHDEYSEQCQAHIAKNVKEMEG